MFILIWKTIKACLSYPDVTVFSGGVLVFSGGVLVFSGGVLVFSGGVLVSGAVGAGGAVVRWCVVLFCLILS